MSFVRRKIALTFQLGKGTFGESGFDTVELTDHRVQCVVRSVYGPGMGQASLRVYGLTPDLLNQLSSLNQATEAVRRNVLIVKAGDEGAVPATVFQGQITLAQVDMNAAPNVALNLMAHSGMLLAAKGAEATSYPDRADAATILYNLAQSAGLGFENSGASKILYTPAFEGSYRKQIADCARAADFNWVIENDALAIWPAGSSRGGDIVLIGSDNGMIGYPSYSTSNNGGGILVRTLFNPQLSIARRVRVQSSLPVASGVWTVWNLTHELDADVPGGKWETTFDGSPYGA